MRGVIRVDVSGRPGGGVIMFLASDVQLVLRGVRS